MASKIEATDIKLTEYPRYRRLMFPNLENEKSYLRLYYKIDPKLVTEFCPQQSNIPPFVASGSFFIELGFIKIFMNAQIEICKEK